MAGSENWLYKHKFKHKYKVSSIKNPGGHVARHVRLGA